MATDAITLIKKDHRTLEGLFERLQAGTGDRRALVEEVAARLTAHSRAEERHVYPAITRAAPDERDDVEHAYHEHEEADHLLGKVRNLVESPHFEQALADLVDAVKHHVEEEESSVLPALRDAVDAETLRELGVAFARARAEELGQAGFAEPVDAVATDDAGAVDDDLAGATRDELYEMAKKAEIPGRSSMNKDELTEALREQR